uniref:Uncharacterized protein n=1 Tax=Fagus sylvatica TaxID=28930 RepID=A0A2N9J5I8_FAGSY
MAGKNSKKATSSSRIPPNKLPDVKPELVTPSQLVKYDPHQITQINSPDKPSSSRMVPLGKSPEELAEICRLAAIQCQSATASGKHSPASSEGSTNEAAKVSSQFPHPVPMPLNWYQDPLF